MKIERLELLKLAYRGALEIWHQAYHRLQIYHCDDAYVERENRSWEVLMEIEEMLREEEQKGGEN